MALKGGTKDETVKVQFNTREGTYKQLPISNYFYPKRMPYVPQVPASSSTLVKTSFVTVCDGDDKEDCICFTIGKELFYFTYESFKLSKSYDYLDKRTYKGVAPTCHDVNEHTASAESVRVAVGFIAGQVQIIDVQTKESFQILNDERLVEKSKVTCVKWYPKSENLLLASHISGFMYTYDITQTCSTYIPQYHSQPYKSGDGYTILTLKPKTLSTSSSSSNTAVPRNPIYKWIMSTDGSGVHEFAFSPCSRFVAIVTQNGYLRIIDHTTFELYGCMKSYFGGLSTCCWSPDGRFLVTGGEDDLITVWSLSQQCVIARGSGHRSWISEVAFDPFCCTIPSDADMKTYYGIPSVDDLVAARKNSTIGYEVSNISCDNTISSTNDSRSNKRYLPEDEPNNLQNNTADSGIQLQCNGDIQLSVPVNTIRRLRTYSNVSKLSRLSLGLENGAPPLCYRFGSVGQDAQLCLWEIDETVLYTSQRKTKRFERPPSQASADFIENSPVHVNGTNIDVPCTSSSGSDYSSNGSGVQYHKYNHTSGNSNDVISPLASDSRSSSVPHSINSSLFSTKNRKHSSKSETNSNGLSAIRKFATIGSHDHSRKETKDHKRNLSLPHFGFKNSHNSLNNSTLKGGLNKKQQVQVVKTFGTYLCPHLEDTTMLEPLVCKKISKSRITCLDFKEDAVITTCQDGYLQLWQRPGKPELNSHSPSPLTEQLKPNGTVV